MSAYLFVYGTLRRDGAMHAVLAPHGRFVGNGRMHGRLVDLGAYPGLVTDDAPEAWVRGEIHAVVHPAVAWAALDAYEGEEFERVPLVARLDTAQEIHCWVYRYRGPNGSRRPRGR